MADVCIKYPDGTITEINRIENKWNQDDFIRKIFNDEIGNMLKQSQLGICTENRFIPISNMFGWDEKNKDYSLAVRDLGKKVKKLEKVKRYEKNNSNNIGSGDVYFHTTDRGR